MGLTGASCSLIESGGTSSFPERDDVPWILSIAGVSMTIPSIVDHPDPFAGSGSDTRPIHAVFCEDLDDKVLPADLSNVAASMGFQGKAGELVLVPGADGLLGAAVFGLGNRAEPNAARQAGHLPHKLPAGAWHLATDFPQASAFALGFGLGAYRFARFRKPERPIATLVPGQGMDETSIRRTLAAVYLTRDLINMPANHMGPEALEAASLTLAEAFGAQAEVIRGDALIERNLPMIHTVGRASSKPPRLIDLRWQAERTDLAKVTLVGKGVSFDTGGLDIKPSSSMLLMKKDMGGAAHVLGLAAMIMDARLAVALRVLIPAVENAISGNAFRPGDVLESRKGLSVQVDNTDAEGRLVLADALTYAEEEEPDLLIDMATLTGAARVALGPDLPPFFTDDEVLASSLAAASVAAGDPLWRLPLYQPYMAQLKTPIADLTNAPAGGMAGAITAALFLKRFVAPGRSWVHFDVFGWNLKDRAEGPMGGEAQGIRAIFEFLSAKYG